MSPITDVDARLSQRTELLSMMRIDDGYLQIKVAAEYFGVSTNTQRNWGQAGKITEHRHPVNHYRLHRKAVLDRLLRQAEKSPIQSR